MSKTSSKTMTRPADHLPYLAAGLLTQAEAKALVDEMKNDLDTGSVEELFRAFRSMTVFVLSNRTPDIELQEWAYVIRHVIAALGRSFEGAAERFLTLRFMLQEGAELADAASSEEHYRPGMKDTLSLLAASSPEGLPLSEIEERTGDRSHAIAQRLRLAVSAQTAGIAGNWKRRRFYATGLDPQPREEYPLTGLDEISR